MNAIILAAVLAICHGDLECQTYVADSQPETVEEVILAHNYLYPEGVCK